MNKKFRCSCPCTSALDIVGDKWTLVIIKQMILFHKRTFKEFSETDEAIATNILSARLKMLIEYELIKKEKLPDNKQKNLYILTQRGLNLTPLIVDLMLWSDENIRDYHGTLWPSDGVLEKMRADKEGFITMLIENYKEINWLQHWL